MDPAAHAILSTYDLEKSVREKELRPTRRNVRLFLFRHGESTVNEVGTLIGGRASYAELSAKGEDQALKLGSHLAACGTKFDLVFSSTSNRARQSAALVCKEMGLDKKIDTSDELLEQCHGGWEGKQRDEIYTADILHTMEQNIWQFRAPGKSPDGLDSESPQQVEERMMKFVEDHILTKQPGDADGKVWQAAIFGHGLAIKYFLRGVLQSSPHMSRKMRIDNTAIVEVGYDTSSGNKGGWHVHRINDHAHLKDEKLFTRKPSDPKRQRVE